MCVDIGADSRELLRRRVLASRDQLAAVDRRMLSAAAMAHLWQHAPFVEAGVVGLYVNFRSEVETNTLIDQALARGKTVAVPWSDTRTHRLLFCPIIDPGRDLAPGSYGIPEPDPARQPPLDPATLEAVIVPGSVFDRHGGRLGYGGGYYDRFLATAAPKAHRVGFCFDLQLVESVPQATHDQAMAVVVTESGIIRIR